MICPAQDTAPVTLHRINTVDVMDEWMEIGHISCYFRYFSDLYKLHVGFIAAGKINKSVSALVTHVCGVLVSVNPLKVERQN